MVAKTCESKVESSITTSPGQNNIDSKKVELVDTSAIGSSRSWTSIHQNNSIRIFLEDGSESITTSNSSQNHFVGMAPRCKNPEPFGSSIDSTEQTTEPAASSSSQMLAETQKNNKTSLVVPKFVKVSPHQQDLLQCNGIKKEEKDARKKDVQVDFPILQHSVPKHDGTLRSYRRRNRSYSQQYHSKNSSYTSCNSSIPSKVSGKKIQTSDESFSINSSSFFSVDNIGRVPLFQRIVTEEVQELKAYARIVESQNRRLLELERVHEDLEFRLELESNQRMELEKMLEERELAWTQQINQLQIDEETWKKLLKVERMKNAKLMDQVMRKDQNIHRRKYDDQSNEGRNPPLPLESNTPTSTTSSLAQELEEVFKISLSTTDSHLEAPQKMLYSNQMVKGTKERNVLNLILDFFDIAS